jgi:N-formylglutamate deformylase
LSEWFDVAVDGPCWLNARMRTPAAAPPPVTLLRPAVPLAPVILTSPHSGRYYPPSFLAASRLDGNAIRRSEDSFVEELFAAGPALGLPLLAANFPRAYCDVNREAWELDPEMFEEPLPEFVNTNSARVLAGLGTIARVVGNNEAIYGGRLPFAEAQARVAACWQPFHDALKGLIGETVARFGACIVLDCHSMPTLPGRTAGKPQIILGDGHGTSCGPPVMNYMARAFGRLGLDVRRNDPYAGGFITQFYGRPREDVHVVQIEIARHLYMNEAQFGKNAQFDRMQQDIGRFLSDMAVASSALLGLPGPAFSAAAE